ncbi:mCG148444 [Mus musculus]|nr:mCG148444 [Mus musculus]
MVVLGETKRRNAPPTHLVPVAKRRRGLPTRPPPATPQPSVSSREELFSGGVHLANRCGTRKKSHHIPTRVAQCRVLFAAENS